MKRRKHPYGWYKRPCIIYVCPIPGLSNNNLRMHHISMLRSRTERRWLHKYFNLEIKARWKNMWINRDEDTDMRRLHDMLTGGSSD